MLVAIPVVVVFGHVFVPVGEVWGHLVETVLFRYLANLFLSNVLFLLFCHLCQPYFQIQPI